MRTWLELHQAALYENLHTLWQINNRSPITPLIRSNAFGHGTAFMQYLLSNHKLVTHPITLPQDSCIVQENEELLLGAHIYGFWISEKLRQDALVHFPGVTLQPIAQWKCMIAQIKHIPSGAYVGYSRTYQAQRPMTLAILPIGYYDGYPRYLSNNGFMKIRNYLVPVVGIVSMNLVALDVTDIPDVTYQDIVTIYGDDPFCSIERAAQLTQTSPLEITTRINSGIPKIII